MAEDSWFWGGTSVGDAGPYSDEEFGDVLQRIAVGNRTLQGVLKNVYNELAITAVDVDTIAIASGVAMVDGRMYINSTSMNKDLVRRGAGLPNYYSIVLKKDFVAQTVRVGLNVSPTAYPAVTQNESSVWEVEIYRVLVPGGPSDPLQITDMRSFCAFNTVLRNNIIDSADYIVNGIITRNKLAQKLITVACPVVACTRDGVFVPPSFSAGWAYLTSTDGYTNMKGGQFRVPDDVVPEGFGTGVGVRVTTVWGNHTSNPQQIVGYVAIRASSVGDPTWRDDNSGNVIVSLVASQGAKYPTVEILGVGGDSIDMMAHRNGGHPDDLQTESGYLGVSFEHFEISYYVSE